MGDKKMNKFYISLALTFKQDCDVNKIEKLLGLKAYKKIGLKDSKGLQKLAKIIFKSNEFEGFYSDEIFEKYLIKNLNNFKKIPEILSLYDGECHFSIVITSLRDKPCVGLSLKSIKILSNINASYDVDFI